MLTKRKKKKSQSEIAQKGYEMYWTSHGNNIPVNNSCTATNLPSLKLSKWVEQDVQNTVRDDGMNP